MKKTMALLDEKPYAAIIYVKEDSKQVVVHFSGFHDLPECDLFSVYLMEELGLADKDFRPKNCTLH